MKRSVAGVVALLPLLATAVCSERVPANSPDPPSPFEVREGQRLFASHCAPCHGEEGHGDGAYLSADAPAAPPDFAADDIRGRVTVAAVTQRLQWTDPRGETHCPPWGNTFSAEEITSLATFMEKLAQARPPAETMP